MGKRTSVYLSDGLYEAWRASGVPLSELVRQALDAGEDSLALRVGRAALNAAGHATRGGTATEVPSPAHATSGGTSTTPSGTPEPGETKTAATKKAPAVAPVAADLAGIPLTVASALPKPRRCTHAGKRSVGGWCKDCDHLIEPGGAWA